MTAQIGILNKNIAVIASDSASTVSTTKNTKIFGKAKKIFKIADNIPVGIMINGGMYFSEIPWGKVIALYAKYVNEEKDTLGEYFDDFIGFIQGNDQLSGYGQNYAFFRDWVFSNLNKKAVFYAEHGSDRKKFKNFIEREIGIISGIKKSVISESERDKVNVSIKNYIDELSSSRMFNNPLFLKQNKLLLAEVLTHRFMKVSGGGIGSQIVFVGFGQNDLFPSIINVYIEGMWGGKLRLFHKREVLIGNTALSSKKFPSYIVPFAQDEGLELFLEGIALPVKNYLFASNRDTHKSLLSFVLNHDLLTEALDAKSKKRLSEDLKSYAERLQSEFKSSARDYCQFNYASPIIKSVKFMETQDIVELARTLVNLTSVRRRFAIDQKETVGGDINAVVLSKEFGYRSIEQQKI